MAGGWRCIKLSLPSSAIFQTFSGMCYLLLLYCSFIFVVFVLLVFMLSLELCRCSSDLFLFNRPSTEISNHV